MSLLLGVRAALRRDVLAGRFQALTRRTLASVEPHATALSTPAFVPIPSTVLRPAMPIAVGQPAVPAWRLASALASHEEHAASTPLRLSEERLCVPAVMEIDPVRP